MKRINQRQLRRMVLVEQRKVRENRRIKAVAMRADRLLNEQFVGSRGKQAAMQMVQRSSPDAIAIYKALKGLGTDEDAVYAVLNKRQNSIPQLYEEYSALMVELKQASSGFMGKVKKYGMPFLAGSGLFALALNLDPEMGEKAENALRKTVYKVKGGGKAPDMPKVPSAKEFKKDAAGATKRFTDQLDATTGKLKKNADAYVGALSMVPKGAITSRTGPGLEKRIADKINPGVDAAEDGSIDPLAGSGKLSMGQKIAGAAISGAALAAVAALIGSILPDSLDDDLIDWLEDDGMDDAADFVKARLQPGQRRG